MQLSKESIGSLNSCHCNQTRIFTYIKFSETIKGGGGVVTVKIQNLAFCSVLKLSWLYNLKVKVSGR